ncbi:alpha/beta hydrolase [Frigoribacterium salinisoli]
MSSTAPRRRPLRRAGQVLVALGVAVVLLVVAFLVYAHDVMPGDRGAALEVWRDDAVSVRDAGDAIVLIPTGTPDGVGLVFVPGAKVDPWAYLATFREVVAAGTTVVITEPTLNLAILDRTPLDAFTGLAPEVATWAVGGHSLGGVRACALAVDDDVSGLLLLGSYCLEDLSSRDLDVLSLAGSEDGLSTPDDVAARRGTLPADAELVELQGVAHAQFGAYGEQPGDGTPTVSDDEARALVAARVRDWAADLR